MSAPLRIGITTGDADGIGTEVVSKALRKLGPQRGVRFYLWRSPSCPALHLKRIDAKFQRHTFTTWTQAQEAEPRTASDIIDICSHKAPAFWVQTAAEACMFRRLDALITGPLSKTSIIEAGFKDIGHTSILKRVAQVSDVFMGFFGNQFNVALVTDHIPLSQVSLDLTPSKIEACVRVLAQFISQLKGPLSKKPIGILGLNPHGGEDGLLGTEERALLIPLVQKLKKDGLKIEGPLVPDAAFLKQNWEKFSSFLALYHDQGLIPFKAFHGQQSGVHISLGLPFIRTSVDHGTAKDVFGKETADERSMVDALKWGIRLAQAKQNK